MKNECVFQNVLSARDGFGNTRLWWRTQAGARRAAMGEGYNTLLHSGGPSVMKSRIMSFFEQHLFQKSKVKTSRNHAQKSAGGSCFSWFLYVVSMPL
jgi:hypothetical protein